MHYNGTHYVELELRNRSKDETVNNFSGIGLLGFWVMLSGYALAVSKKHLLFPPPEL